MKNILLLGLASVLLLGAGCASNLSLGGDKEVEGDWDLVFNLPSGWVMAAPYDSDELEEDNFALNTDVGQSDSEIFLQASDKPVYLTASDTPEVIAGFEAAGEVVVNKPVVKVTRLDERRLIPDEAEDVGRGYSRVKLCEDGESCQTGGRLNYDYYYETEDGKYKFVAYHMTWQEAEDIITSAEVVTVHPGADVDVNVETE